MPVVSSGGLARSPLVGPVLSSMRPCEVSVFSGGTASGELAGAALTGAFASAGVFGTVAGAPAPGSLGIVGFVVRPGSVTPGTSLAPAASHTLCGALLVCAYAQLAVASAADIRMLRTLFINPPARLCARSLVRKRYPRRSTMLLAPDVTGIGCTSTTGMGGRGASALGCPTTLRQSCDRPGVAANYDGAPSLCSFNC